MKEKPKDNFSFATIIFQNEIVYEKDIKMYRFENNTLEAPTIGNYIAERGGALKRVNNNIYFVR